MLTSLILILIAICTVFDCFRFKIIEDEVEELKKQLEELHSNQDVGNQEQTTITTEE